MTDAVILSGFGRYGDGWHPFEETSAAIAEVLGEAGLTVEVRPTTQPAALDPGDARLVVVNVGGGVDQPEPDPEWTAAQRGLASFVAGGGALLAVHSAAIGFRDWAGWADLIGGAWVPGVSEHPTIGEAIFCPAPGAEAHPAVAGLAEVRAYDERYYGLRRARTIAPLLGHDHDGRFEVVCWAVGRVLYDGLGHDARSYASATRRRLLAQEALWLLESPA